MRYQQLVLRLISLFLGITFTAYGVLKLLGGQFLYHGFVIDSTTTDGPTLVWAFYGYSPVYGRLIGLAEVIPGLLLLWARTRLVGALMILPVATNITVMDFCLHFPAVKYFALLLTCLTLVLLGADSARLRQAASVLLARPLSTQAADTITPANASRKSRLAFRGLGLLLGILGGLFLVNLYAGALSDPIGAAYACCEDRGWRHDELSMKRCILRSGALGFQRAGFVEFETKTAHPPRTVHVEVYRPIELVHWRITEYQEIPSASDQPHE